MELRQLNYFVQVAETGSVSRASRALHIAQPALSQQINRLESELGVKLLTRSVRGVVPTEAGVAFLAQARLVLQQVNAAKASAVEAGRLRAAGPVSVGLPWTIASLLGLALLKRTKAAFPDIRLEIIQGPSQYIADQLAGGDVEIGVMFDLHRDTGIALSPIAVETLMFVGRTDEVGTRASIAVRAAAACPMVMMSRPNTVREMVEAEFTRAGLTLDIVAQLNAPNLLFAAIEAGLGFSVLPACGLDVALQRGEITAVPLDDSRLTRTVYVGTSRLVALTAAAQRVRDLIAQLMQEAIGEGRWQARLLATESEVVSVAAPNGTAVASQAR